jgi:hypothetical protein
MRFILLIVMLTSVGCRLSTFSDSTGAECGDAQDCDDSTLGCVSTKDDNINVGVGNTRGVCLPPPDGWTCDGDFWNDNEELCDCGCGIVDADCAGDATEPACDENNCPSGQNPQATDNSQCG